MSKTEFTAKVGFVRFCHKDLSTALKEAAAYVDKTGLDLQYDYLSVQTDRNSHAANPTWLIEFRFYS